jgi:pimeloyl-ACP methyl ester carboxylesterase
MRFPITEHVVKTARHTTFYLACGAAGAPPAILVHGWPELSISWRHQMPVLAALGFRAIAPDMRGYGRSEAPADVAQYTIMHTVGDVVGLVAALGETRAVVVGHDWGAPVAWHAAMLRPDLFRGVVALSVPHRHRGATPPLQALRAAGVTRFYWQYFQAPGVAEAEFERDVARTMRTILGAAGFGRQQPQDAPMMVPEAGFLAMIEEPKGLPEWLAEEDLAVMVENFSQSGFRGGLNYYRNIDRNWELTAPLQNAKITPPALFIGGTRDVVLHPRFAGAALQAMPQAVPNLRKTVMLEGAGHWIQQERPAEVNAELIGFLNNLG